MGKSLYRRFGKQRESDEIPPHELCLQKIAFEFRLGFENLEIYTLKAFWEQYTDLHLAIGKHLGHIEPIVGILICTWISNARFVPQLNPCKSMWIAFNFPLKTTQLLKKSVDEPPESLESELALNKTTTHI